MRIILVLIIISIICGFFGYHKYSEKRYKALVIALNKAQENNEELNKTIVILQQKLLLEVMKAQSVVVTAPSAKEKLVVVDLEKLRLEEERNKRLQMIAAKKSSLEELKNRYSQLRVAPSKAQINTEVLASKISSTKSKIQECESLLKKAAELGSNKKFVCFDACINGTDIKFERKMTRTCKSVVSGGMYFCDHYDMLGSDYCTRHLHNHKGWKFPNRYRDDHRASVRYFCRTHNIVWDQASAAYFFANYKNGRSILGQRLHYRRSITVLKRALSNLERDYRIAVAKNRDIKNHESQVETIEQQRSELRQQMAAIESDIEKLERENMQ